MIKLVVFRLLQAVPTMLGVTVVVFLIVRLTGDPTLLILPENAPAEAVAAFRQKFGLDQPLIVQYFIFMGNLLQGDLGTSIRYQQPVAQLIAERIPATVQLALSAIVFSTVTGVILGTLGGLRRATWLDYTGRALALAGQAVPVFFMGIVLILIFGVWLRVLPTVGTGDFRNLILPAATLGFYLLPLVLRITRGSVLDVVHKDYVRTARSKGMPESRVVGVHVLKNSLIPIVTVLGLQVGSAISGSVVTEVIFSWPGIGQLLVNAIATRDFPVVQGVALFAASVFIVINIIVDIVYSALDPRIRLS